MIIFLVLKPLTNKNDRVRNLLKVTEIASIFQSEDGEVPEYNVLLCNKTGILETLSYLSFLKDPATYPLFILTGALECEEKKHIKKPSFNFLHHKGLLFQLFVVNDYTAIKRDCLNYVIKLNKDLKQKNNNKQIKDLLEDYLIDEEDNKEVAKRNRFMHLGYQDGMTIVRKFEKPDFFITMITNLNQRKITKNLYPEQSPNDRHNLITRVFKHKSDALIHDLKENKIMGNVVYLQSTIEFQKRSLPNIHILVKVSKNDFRLTSDKVDECVKAEFPDKERNPQRYHKVTFISSKVKDNIKRPFYSLLDITDRFGNKVNNDFCVTYNPYLSLKYSSYIKVKICESVLSPKYLFKYTHKSNGDKIEADVVETVDSKDKVKLQSNDKDAAIARGLLDTEDNYNELFQEACESAMPNMLRNYFGLMICY
uniref:Helitron_like_N domain-containing protein n=1 Tax=Strongyloides venezuelensis TaxID=75913 RepID=A0A0K0F166_STRVS